MEDAVVINPAKQIVTVGSPVMYRIFTSSGLRSVLGSYARLFLMHLLYYEPEGLTCSMIYGLYKKDILDRDVPEEVPISRSNIVDLLSDFEVEGLIKKGAFKQYMLTEKGRAIFDLTRRLAIGIANDPKLLK